MKRKILDKKGIRLQTAPAAPVTPANGCRAGMSFLAPAWMYDDPADVAERLELQANARVERQRKARARPEEQGLSPVTLRNMRRLRIRELVSEALKGRR